jgi:TolA-binding protein
VIRRFGLAGALWLACACGSPPPAAYVRESKDAEKARDRGDHLEAARHYERAALKAGKARDADEARYRAADSYARAGDAARAEALYRALAKSPDSERAARADFALAELWQKQGRAEQARTQRVDAMHRHPSSGLAARALTAHLAELREQEGGERVLAFLTAEQESAVGQSELAETIAYRRARELTELGRHAEARDAYLSCAERFPYPGGAYWDDALYRAAEAELALGQPERARSHLTRLLREQEGASITGSYQRGRYAEAQLKLAEIYRDLLHDPARARLELRKVWLHHPTSRLVDDALFQEALLAHRSGDTAGTCAPLRIIVSKLPDSRYAPCAHVLCESMPATSDRACRDYILREGGLTTNGASRTEAPSR